MDNENIAPVQDQSGEEIQCMGMTIEAAYGEISFIIPLECQEYPECDETYSFPLEINYSLYSGSEGGLMSQCNHLSIDMTKDHMLQLSDMLREAADMLDDTPDCDDEDCDICDEEETIG